MKNIRLLALAVASAAGSPLSVNAADFVASAAQLGANDTLAWDQLGPAGSTIANPVMVASTGGQTVTVSEASGHGFVSQAGPGYGPMYAQGERLYLTDNGFGFNGGPLTFVFARDVLGFGTVCDPDYYLQGFAGTISAYDAADALLGSFAFSVSADAPYKQVFAGIAEGSGAIHRVVIDGTFAQSLPEAFTVGIVSIRTDAIFDDGFDP